MTVYIDSATRYPTKKSLKEALEEGREVFVQEESLFSSGDVKSGTHALCGPTSRERKWYGTVTTIDNQIVKVV